VLKRKILVLDLRWYPRSFTNSDGSLADALWHSADEKNPSTDNSLLCSPESQHPRERSIHTG